jgi:anionic cell wall polymer biosynthesis LytR-Cps2A-Psr (LCP) family protein
MFNFSGFNNPMQAQMDAAAAWEFTRQSEVHRANAARAEEQRKVTEQIRLQEEAAQAELARISKINTLNTNAIQALETGNMEAITTLFSQLNDEDRAPFNSVEPLLQALDNQDLSMASYLLEQGFSCDVWEDYVSETEHPELASKLRGKTSVNYLRM